MYSSTVHTVNRLDDESRCLWNLDNTEGLNTVIQRSIVPYSLNQTPLSISSRSWIETAPPYVLNEVVAALEY